MSSFADFKDFFQYPNSRIFNIFFNDPIPKLLVDFLLTFFRASTVGFFEFFSETSFEGFKPFFYDLIRGFQLYITVKVFMIFINSLICGFLKDFFQWPHSRIFKLFFFFKFEHLLKIFNDLIPRFQFLLNFCIDFFSGPPKR